MFTENLLASRSVLVTGGGSGLGLAMAARFVELGANVAICGRTEAKLQAALAVIDPRQTQRADYVVCDVRDYEAVGRMLAHVRTRFGSLTDVVNNAAGNFLAASETLSPNAFKAVVDIVLTGSFNTSTQAGRHWIENQQYGRILNIVTTYTETGCAFVLPSACAKAGVYALTTSLAYEWAPFGIRVNAIAPGPFKTEGAWSRLVPTPGFDARMAQRNPMQRFGEPVELANLAAFLLSDLSPYINGECVSIDGGERLQGAQFNAIAQLMPRAELKQTFADMRANTKKV